MASSSVGSNHVIFKEGDRARCTFGFRQKSDFGQIKLIKDEVVEIVSTFGKEKGQSNVAKECPIRRDGNERSALLQQIRAGIQLQSVTGKAKKNSNVPSDLMKVIEYRRSKVDESSDESGDDDDKWN